MLGNIGAHPFGQITAKPSTKPTFKDQEDYVYRLLEDTDEGVLALLYKSLYARGFRIGTVDPLISKLRRSLATPSS